MYHFRPTIEEIGAREAHVRAVAESLGVPVHIKHANRWCKLQKKENGLLTYTARPKEQRARSARHKPVIVTLTVAEAREAPIA